MSLSPYVTTLATGARALADTETYDVSTRGRRGVVFVSDVTVIGNGNSFVEGAAPALPLTVGTNSQDTFVFDSDIYTIANGVYSTLATLAAAIGAATKAGPIAFSTLVTPSVSGTSLRFTSVATGVNVKIFATGVHDALVPLLGVTNAWTIAHTSAGGTDGAFSQTITIQGKDEASGKYYTILAAAAQSTVSTKILQAGPDLTDSANLVAAALLPATIRVSISHTTNNSITRTLGLQLVA